MSILSLAIVPLAASVHVRAAGGNQVTTTLYVGRHFEVRDHDQPVKYVFDGNTRVARVTGSLSPNSRLQRWRLQSGWNLVSLAVTAPALREQLDRGPSGATGLVNALYLWQPATHDYAAVAAGQTVSSGGILWIRAATNGVVTVAGEPVAPGSARVPAGGGFVPSPGLEAWTPSLPPGATSWKFSSGPRAWEVALPGDLALAGDAPPTLAPGEAVYIQTEEPADLALPDPGSRVLYYHPDHLGSSSVTTDANGAVVNESAYYPFGALRHEERLRPIEAHYGFTQKERDAESSLHSFGHRYLSSALGRWISTDPLLEKGGGPNPYAYVNQRPLTHQDPDGAEITVTKHTKAGITTYEFKMQAVLIDVSSAKFSQQELTAYSSKLKAKIEKAFNGREGKSQWTASVNLRVIRDYSEVGDCDHVIRITDKIRREDKTHHDAAGATVIGTKVIDIKASTLRRPRPDQVDRSNPANKHYTWENYISAEGTGTHEVGHSAGLEHVHGQANLMQPGDERKNDNTDITLKQIKIMFEASSSGKLNQRDDELNKITGRR